MICNWWNSNSVTRNSAQFREYLIASLFAIIAQFRAMNLQKWKQTLRTIFRLETLLESKEFYIFLALKYSFTSTVFIWPAYSQTQILGFTVKKSFSFTFAWLLSKIMRLFRERSSSFCKFIKKSETFNWIFEGIIFWDN